MDEISQNSTKTKEIFLKNENAVLKSEKILKTSRFVDVLSFWSQPEFSNLRMKKKGKM